jgi:hypothetical protein
VKPDSTTFDPFLWSVRVAGMSVFVVTVTASIVTLLCSIESECNKYPVNSLWLQSGFGSLVMLAVTAKNRAPKQTKKLDTTGNGNL